LKKYQFSLCTFSSVPSFYSFSLYYPKKFTSFEFNGYVANKRISPFLLLLLSILQDMKLVQSLETKIDSSVDKVLEYIEKFNKKQRIYDFFSFLSFFCVNLSFFSQVLFRTSNFRLDIFHKIGITETTLRP